MVLERSNFVFYFQPKQQEHQKEYGRGNRQRKQVNYCDDLTDEQFLKMCQQDEEEGEGEEEEGGSSNLVVVPKRGRGRRPKPKLMTEEAMIPLSNGYVERNEKSRSNEDEYFEED